MNDAIAVVPKYEQLRKRLARAISQGEYPPHSPLPTQRQLMDQYRLSFSTVRRAVEELVRNGAAYSKPGKGVFVAETSVDNTNRKLVFTLFGVCPETANLLPTGWVAGLLQAQHELDFFMRLIDSRTLPDMSQRLRAGSEKSDGAILMGLVHTRGLIQTMHEVGFPYVVLDVPQPRERVNAIVIDHEAAALDLTNHLIRRGHRNIAYVGLAPGQTEAHAWSNAKYAGYVSAMNAAGLPISEKCTYLVDSYLTPDARRVASRAVAEMLLPHRQEISAVFVAVESLAYAVIDELTARGVHVPGDIAVGACNDEEGFPGRLRPIGLTTIRMPLREAARQAVELLSAQVQGRESFPQQRMLRGELVVRESTLGGTGSSDMPRSTFIRRSTGL